MIDIDWLRRATTALRLELPSAVADDYCPKVHAALDYIEQLEGGVRGPEKESIRV